MLIHVWCVSSHVHGDACVRLSPPLVASSASASVWSSCSFCSVPPPRPINTPESRHTNKKREMYTKCRCVPTHLHERGAKHKLCFITTGRSLIQGRRQQKHIQTLLALTSRNHFPSNLGLFTCQSGSTASSLNILSGCLRNTQFIIKILMSVTNGVEKLSWRLNKENKPCFLQLLVNTILFFHSVKCLNFFFLHLQHVEDKQLFHQVKLPGTSESWGVEWHDGVRVTELWLHGNCKFGPSGFSPWKVFLKFWFEKPSVHRFKLPALMLFNV